MEGGESYIIINIININIINIININNRSSSHRIASLIHSQTSLRHQARETEERKLETERKKELAKKHFNVWCRLHDAGRYKTKDGVKAVPKLQKITHGLCWAGNPKKEKKRPSSAGMIGEKIDSSFTMSLGSGQALTSPRSLQQQSPPASADPSPPRRLNHKVAASRSPIVAGRQFEDTFKNSESTSAHSVLM